MANVDPITIGIALEPWRISMTHAFTLWFGRFFAGARATAYASSRDEPPLRIEVERLPDHLWRELGFHQPRRPGENLRG